MPTPFLSSEEYDERAHKQYDRGDYDGALDTLKDGLRLYPHSVDLYVGLAYTRLAREEFMWAKDSFEKALVLDPEHDDAMVGLGEVLLRLGRPVRALSLFHKVRHGPAAEDTELLLAMGRALYREGRFEEARSALDHATTVDPEDVEVIAALGYTLHRIGDDAGALRHLRDALALNPAHHEARIYLAHMLHDRGEWEAALAAFAVLPPAQHWDPLAVWRLIELKRTVGGVDPSDPELLVWEGRLEELETEVDPVDEILTEIEAAAREEPEPWPARARQNESADARSGTGGHRVRLPDGCVLEGSWFDIVRQLRDQAGRSHESVAQFMRRWAESARVRIGVGVPVDDAEGFLLAHARAGLLHIER